MDKRAWIWLIAAACAAPLPGEATSLDSNFSESVFANVGSQVTGLAWAPDGSGRLFVSRKTGPIVIVMDGTVVPFATVSPLYTSSECGVIGICLDPDFINNGYVYVFATVSSSEQQIIRYTAVGDVGTDKTVLVRGLPTAGVNHDGGGLEVGPDGKLYWGIGDNGIGLGVNADLASLAAKIGRANLDGTVPADNPFVDGPGGNNDYIWARGFRNPYTLTFQPNTGALWVNCVGTLYEQIFLVNRGDHAGWNAYENNQPAGFITPRIKYRTNGTDTRNLLANGGAVRAGNIATFTTTAAHGFRPGEKITVSGVSAGSFNGAFYVAATPSANTFSVLQTGPDATSGGGTATTLNQGGCVTGGCFYESTAAAPQYRGNLFYGDLNSGRMMRATFGASNDVTSVDYFVNNISQAIDTTVGPDGALYYVVHPGTIYRLAYTNFSAQQLVVTPTAVRMFEGGATAVNVRLAMAPAGEVQVEVARSSGDSGIDVSAGRTLTFSPANWSVPQRVTLQANSDADSANSSATLTVSAAGLASETVVVHALDRGGAVTMNSISREPGIGLTPVRIELSGQPGQTFVLEGTTNLLDSWTPLATNTLSGTSTNFTDPGSVNLPLRFYRTRVAP